MKIMTDNMWSARKESDLFLFTSNGVINRGMLVMGGGFAGQMLKHVSTSLPKGLGRAIARESGVKPITDGNYDGTYDYGLLVSKQWPEVKWGAFQTKLHYRDDTPLDLVQRSVDMLQAWCDEHPDKRVDCNFPGIGLGRRTWAEILPIIQSLPDQVHFWTYERWSTRPHYDFMPTEFYQTVNKITNGIDPDEFLTRPEKFEPAGLEWEHKQERAGLFSYIFLADGDMFAMAETNSYEHEPHQDLILYKVFDDMMACAMVVNENTWIVQSLKKVKGQVIWTPPPVHMQTEEDYLKVFPQFREGGYKYGI